MIGLKKVVFCKKDVQIIEKIRKFYKAVHNNVNKKIEEKLKSRFETDFEKNYWIQLLLMQAQTQGLLLGFNQRNETKIGIEDLYFLNADGQISELITLFSNIDYFPSNNSQNFRYKLKKNIENKVKKRLIPEYIQQLFDKYQTNDFEEIWEMIEIESKCSAFIKLLREKNGKIKDILVSHSTWEHYSEMLRVYKQ